MLASYWAFRITTSGLKRLDTEENRFDCTHHVRSASDHLPRQVLKHTSNNHECPVSCVLCTCSAEMKNIRLCCIEDSDQRPRCNQLSVSADFRYVKPSAG